ncbi:carbon monoxide dehydrogenase subunit G [Starkeya sp. ORNL1]|uniref:SRPBCC family protein n=1 Tax=Starkeya sp. ORNL1 TaxID=2709380 RepID=UPI001463CDD9|nr:carbon monoxide dehydrogenase subunit G [Starkeya sp. ORNL1]QJP12407.1 carbon monoxide dehydrogenase subunit G [Starkeya sp. ORNL1]
MALEMSGDYELPVPRERVWAALNDPEMLKRCIPGCEELEKTSDTEFRAVAVAKVGPVKARFKGNVTLSDFDAPVSYRISGQGDGGIAGFAKGGALVRLEATEAGGTNLHYEAEAQIGGKLAQIGQRLVAGTAKKIADEFFANFAKAVAGDGSAAAA